MKIHYGSRANYVKTHSCTFDKDFCLQLLRYLGLPIVSKLLVGECIPVGEAAFWVQNTHLHSCFNQDPTLFSRGQSAPYIFSGIATFGEQFTRNAPLYRSTLFIVKRAFPYDEKCMSQELSRSCFLASIFPFHE